MTRIISRHMPLRRALAAIAVAAALPLAACNPLDPADQSAQALPPLPATLPLAPGEIRAPVFAPAAEQLPYVEPIDAVRVADPDDYYAYADDAWGFADALGYAPPDYGFDYDDVEPWAWQGYDDSLMFVEPLEDGYRTYYYRAGEDDPYFIRDPYYGYGYDDGRLAMVYAADGGIIPYHYYGPRLDYASRYYARGRHLYGAAHRRRPVIAREWEARRVPLLAAQSRWGMARERQQPWQAYHARNAAREARYWREERTRRNAEAVRFAAWREQDFSTPPPPRAIPANWRRADWARDERLFSPPSRGFDGDAADRRRAAADERFRLAALNRQALQERRDANRDTRRDMRVDQRRLREDDVRRAAELASVPRDRPQAQERLERRAFAQQQAQAGRQQPRDRQARQEQRAAEHGAQVQQRQAQAEARRVEAEQHRQARNEQARNSQAERQQRRQQAEARRNEARRGEARQAAQQREQAQARGREQAEERRHAQARQREEAQTRARAQAEQRRGERAAREQSRQAARQSEQRQQAEQRQSEQRQQAEQRRQAQRQQAETGAAERTQQREQAQQRRQAEQQARQQAQQQARQQERAQARAARTERPQREARAEARAERLAQAGGRERRERRQN